MKITPDLFEAYLKCPTKCWLRATGETSAGNTYPEWVKAQNNCYRAVETERLIAGSPSDEVALSPGMENVKAAKWRLASSVAVLAQVDSCLLESELHAVERVPAEGRGKPAQFIPIRFVFTNKLGKDDKLLLAFDAFALSKSLGREISLGKIIHGEVRGCARESAGILQNQAADVKSGPTTAALSRDQPQITKVKTSSLASEVRKRIEKMAALLASPTPPDLVLNRHCPECEFQARCRKIAIEKDDLSLLSSMSAKERQKLRSKGIFTVTQLSYTFRPRRRPKKLRDKREKYHHSLKALAIREKKIHIVGSPELKIEGTPVYLDVEGLPDRDFYYLIGVRIGNGESAVQHSLWADTAEDEGKIWREFLGVLETVDKPVLIHYGSYETRFFERMTERHGGPTEASATMQTIGSAVNLLAFIYAQIYFPTLSNGLKDVAKFMGFSWPDPGGTGRSSVIWRYQWEKGMLLGNQQKLFVYNRADCQALDMLVEALRRLPSHENSPKCPQDHRVTFVTGNLPNAYSHPDWQKFESIVPELEQINDAAQWDYQRNRIYLRAKRGLSRKPERALEAQEAKKGIRHAERVVSFPKCPVCPKCLRRSTDETGQVSRFFHDLLFGRSLAKRRIVRYDFYTFWCEACRLTFGVPKRFHSCQGLGWNLIALYFYSAIELGFPQRPVAKLLERLFNISISGGVGSRLKTRVGKYYEITRQKLIEKIASGHLVHVDETKARIRGGAGYVWVFANLEEVVYLHSESREAEILMSVLNGFKGVLVSDFYPAYDSLNCPQQKCLVHLIRDLNNEVLAHPYDEELKQIVRDFGTLLTPIIDRIDRSGLKKHFLHKYSKSVDRFFKQMSLAEYHSESARKLKQRFEKNHDKLFTFLRHDGVPWNNNNAEHAIKAYATLREIFVGPPTPKAISEYLILLSACETCKCKGVDFLDFLRSGETDIDAFAESRRGRMHRSPTSEPKALPANESTQK